MKDQKTEAPQIPTVELGGRFWEMRFSHKAMRRFCSMTKCTMTKFDDALDVYDNYAKLIWCILWAQDSSITLDQVNAWLDELPTMGDVVALVQDCIQAAMKKPEDGGKETPKPASDDGWDEDEENPTGETTSL